ncbi:hypothetical protein ElyMa_001674500 [Elysia marginata]|uniref:Uncharacterized protein n=1 Tax=Elysia marginata TaxID=1093978 RepID=A0AAV4JWI3_9GAST|nr:hypothetical protein ElyMa_001674500 [Elysia marginata]
MYRFCVRFQEVQTSKQYLQCLGGELCCSRSSCSESVPYFCITKHAVNQAAYDWYVLHAFMDSKIRGCSIVSSFNRTLLRSPGPCFPFALCLQLRHSATVTLCFLNLHLRVSVCVCVCLSEYMYSYNAPSVTVQEAICIENVQRRES